VSRLRVLRRLGVGQDGLTLVELLIASTMAVVIVGAAGSMLISALRDQPNLSGRAQNIASARWALERLTREIRQGVAVDRATANEVSLRTYVRRTACGSSGTLEPSKPAIECEVTYACSSNACTRTESSPGSFEGTAVKVFDGIDSSEVFSYTPSVEEPTYVGISLRLPNPAGSGSLAISDGANLRNATLSN
jgi:type II secretory pathway pseudopilin PulG